MAEAKITTANGISAEVRGTPEEISAVLKRLRSEDGITVFENRQGKRHRKIGEPKPGKRVLISDLIDILKEDEFFKPPKGLGELRAKFADMGHHYPLTTLSGAMQKQVKARRLRRFKQEGKYVYTH